MHEKEEIIRILGLKGVYSILKYLQVRGPSRFGNILTTVSRGLLQVRRIDLLEAKLITFNVDFKEGIKEENYSLTSKGEKVIALLDEVVEIFQSS